MRPVDLSGLVHIQVRVAQHLRVDAQIPQVGPDSGVFRAGGTGAVAAGGDKYYEGKASAPVIPSVFAAYKKGDWTISGFFGITGGGGKASFDGVKPSSE